MRRLSSRGGALLGAVLVAALAGGSCVVVIAPDTATARGGSPSPKVVRITIGHSVRGRPIHAFEVQNGPATQAILVVGCIHGDEPAGIPVARRLESAMPPKGVALWMIPDLNPDGVAAGTRQNADGVDLNRNFPWHWRHIGHPGTTFYSGPRSLSEPESRAARRLILRVRPEITIWFHQHQDLVDLSGGNPAIERTFARLVGLRVARLPRYPGSAINWENAKLPGSTAFDVELPAGSLSKSSVVRYSRAVLDLADHLAHGGHWR